MKEVVDILIEKGKTISTMESCTGGAVVNAITNVEGSSAVLKYSAVTYSNEYKIQMGVSEDLINRYSVYSKEVAQDMAKTVADFTNSDYSIGITGKLGVSDPNNNYGDNNIVYISIYEKNKNVYYNYTFDAENISRKDNKDKIIEFISLKLKEIL